MRLEGVDARLCAAFASAKELFRHPLNPRLRMPIHVDEAAGIGVFVAPDGTMGDLYYRRQHRGRLRFAQGSALTFAFDDRLAENEGDRDRRDRSTAAPMIAAVAQRLPDAVLERLVRHLRAYWHRGGTVLGTLLAEARRRGLRLSFPRRWLARSEGMRFLEEHAERLGYHLGVQRLSEVGMPTVTARFAGAHAPRAPTAVEAARMAVARDLYRQLAGEAPLFTRFRVVSVERQGHDFRGKACVVPVPALAASFGEGIATCLARLACGTGMRSRRNADRLTALLEGAMRRAGTLGPFAERWAVAAVDPSREGVSVEGSDDDTVGEDDPFRPRMPVAVLAPPGFPPAEALEARVKKLFAARQVTPSFVDAPVSCPRDAAQHYARGVPSVWIGGTEIEATRGGRPAFAVRTFAAPDGGRALLPGDAAIDAAIDGAPRLRSAGGAFSRVAPPARREAPRPGPAAALEHWLGAHAPAELRERLEDAERSTRRRATSTGALPYAVTALARTMARRALPAVAAELGDDDLEECAFESVRRAYGRAGALLGALRGDGPGDLEQPAPGTTSEARRPRHARRGADPRRRGRGGLRSARSSPAPRPRWPSPAGWTPCRSTPSARGPAPLEALTLPARSAPGLPGRRSPRRALASTGAVAHAIRRHDERDADGNAPLLLHAARRARRGLRSPRRALRVARLAPHRRRRARRLGRGPRRRPLRGARPRAAACSPPRGAASAPG